MKVLVTGCAGFVGSKVGEIVIHSGAHVVGVDNLNRGYDPRLKEWRLSQLRGKPNFTFHHPGDVQVIWANVTKARRVLGWTPKTSLEEGLHNAVTWYEENRAWAAEIDLGG